jgi:hypothetical protein
LAEGFITRLKFYYEPEEGNGLTQRAQREEAQRPQRSQEKETVRGDEKKEGRFSAPLEEL